MSDKRLNNQLDLAFPTEDTGEAPRAVQEVTESLAANRGTESPGMGDQGLMEAVCARVWVTKSWKPSVSGPISSRR